MTWLNDITNSGLEIAAAHMAYGNEVSLAWHYSHAVILIEIPNWADRHAANAAGDAQQ